MALLFLKGTGVDHWCVHLFACLSLVWLPTQQAVLAFSIDIQNKTQPTSLLHRVLLCLSVYNSLALVFSNVPWKLTPSEQHLQP
ncbi:hypothetical protein I79_009157 [Cricetulus griseus]|uniref:Uncharacterized protein n=1 Tax=Cricetulus griseus TaxID=10029 RepID=G3HF05_CRIGR|nr:hypothetical protein I79_009157 [Cricetulus griseus]